MLVSVLLALTTHGALATKPSCFPNYAGPVVGADQYVQGPSAVRQSDGSLTVLVDTGTGTGEGTYALVYSASAAAWKPIQATNDFDRRARTIHESAFPSLVKRGDEWLLFSTETVWWGDVNHPAPCDYFAPVVTCSRDRDRVSFWRLPCPSCLPSDERHFWLLPQSPCEIPYSCPGSGSGFASAVVVDGTLYVYHRDDNATVRDVNGSWACPSGWWRTTVRADMAYDVPPDCATFDGPTPAISDAATFVIPGPGGWDPAGVRLLATDWTGTKPRGYVSEWAALDGLHFSLIGETALPCEPPCFVADPAYLRDESGAPVEPPVLFAITGRTPDTVGGDWRLYYAAADGAVLPRTFGMDAPTVCSTTPPRHLGPVMGVPGPVRRRER